MCMHNFQTQAAYGYTGSIRAEKKNVELRAGPYGMPLWSPTGHWKFVPLYVAHKLPGSSHVT